MPPPEPYKIIRSSRHTISLEITPEAHLIVRAPRRTTDTFITRFVQEKSDWIERKQREIKNRPVAGKKAFVNGELFLFLGSQYPLEILPGSDSPVTLGKHFYIGELCLPQGQVLFRDWYTQRAKEIVPTRVAGYAALLDYSPTKIRISDTRRRWASCSTSGTLSFCWRLILAPPEITDYVIVHELVHMRQPDHSPRFWEKVRHAMPDFQKHRDWLYTNGRLLEI